MNNGIFQGIAKDFTGDGGPRRRIVTLTSSVPALPIPSWAQGGKGIVYVTGCGGGGGGGGRDSGPNIGTPVAGGGGSGATAVRYPLPIPAGVTTLSCQVGADGTPGIDDSDDSTSNNSGGNGGVTSVTGAAFPLLLGGGGGGRSDGSLLTGVASGGAGGNVDAASSVPNLGPAHDGLRNGFAGVSNNGSTATGFFAAVRAGQTVESAGASSFFGRGGQRPPSGTSVSPAEGYGSGGSGARAGAGNAGAGAGRPGFLILEIVEGF